MRRHSTRPRVMRQRAHWALVMSLVLFLGQAMLPMAASACPCETPTSAAAEQACCCGHPPGEACPCSPHSAGSLEGTTGAIEVSGSCVLDAPAAAAGIQLEAPRSSVTTAPTVPVLRVAIALPHLAAGHAAPHGPPRLIASLTALRSIILRT